MQNTICQNCGMPITSKEQFNAHCTKNFPNTKKVANILNQALLWLAKPVDEKRLNDYLSHNTPKHLYDLH
ncbi:hypothetical protein, partial [Helicobacter ganmani]|uniref:hypothetical protein n=1 Tax=Helicobacter ganmani TaxID=60246 RepID=UPI003A89CD0F